MKRTWIALLAVISLAQASGLQAQEADTTKVSPEAPSTQKTIVFVGEKSPFTAGILSVAIRSGWADISRTAGAALRILNLRRLA